MSTAVIALVVVLVLLIVLALAVRIVKQYERGVLFRLGRLQGTREPGRAGHLHWSSSCLEKRVHAGPHHHSLRDGRRRTRTHL